MLDTNVVVAAAYNAGSASRRILEGCRRGRFRLVASRALMAEYERMLPRAIRHRDRLDEALELLRAADIVEPAVTPVAVRSDPEDDKLFAAAWAGGAEALVTNDEAVLRIDGAEGIRVVRPGEFLRLAGDPDS